MSAVKHEFIFAQSIRSLPAPRRVGAYSDCNSHNIATPIIIPLLAELSAALRTVVADGGAASTRRPDYAGRFL